MTTLTRSPLGSASRLISIEKSIALNPVAELLMDQFLDRGTINGNDLVPSVDQRIGRHRGWQRPLVGCDLEPGNRLIGQSEDSADMTKASGCRPFLALPDRRGNTGLAYVLLDLGCADHARHFTALG